MDSNDSNPINPQGNPVDAIESMLQNHFQADQLDRDALKKAREYCDEKVDFIP